MRKAKQLLAVTFVLALWVSIAAADGNLNEQSPQETRAAASSHDSKAIGEIISVAADGTAPYRSVQTAIDAAADKAVIRIAPGTYDGPLRVTKPVTLEGAGWERTLLVGEYSTLDQVAAKAVPPESKPRFDELVRKLKSSSGDEYGNALAALWVEFGPKPTVTVSNCRDVVLRGLRISMRGEVREGGWQDFPMVLVRDAGVRITDCALAGSPVDGLQITGATQVECVNCLFAGIRATGITVDITENSRARIVGCDIRNCGYSGITVRGGGQTAIDGCRISGMEFHGVRYDQASPILAGNVFLRHQSRRRLRDGRDTRDPPRQPVSWLWNFRRKAAIMT